MVWALLLVSLVFRLWYISARQLVADEAVYWSWSRHPAGGYLDHPPMIAYLIGLSTAWFGTSEFGVRFFCPLFAAASLAVLLGLASRLLRERRAVIWVGVIWLSSPLLAGLGTIATPDTPSTFFSLCALSCVLILLSRDEQSPNASAEVSAEAGLWLAFGAFCGLAFTSKYTTVLLPASVGLALLTSPEGRRHLRRPWAYLSVVPALLLFSPVILWNRSHDWASFRFQLHHGLAQTPPSLPAGVVRFLGNELLVATPVLFVLGVALLVRFWMRYRTLPATDRLLLWSATVPLAFFGYAALRAKGEANWPQFAYFPLSLLIVRWMAETWDKGRVGLVRTGCVVAAVGMVVLHVPEALGLALPGRFHQKVMAKLDELTGWRELGQQVGKSNDGRLIVCEKHQDAAEVAFYAPGHPDAWPVGDGKGNRPFAFDYFDNKPDFDAAPGVLFIGYHYERFAQRYGLARGPQGAGLVRLNIRLPTGGNRSWQLIFLDREPKSPTTVPTTRPENPSRGHHT